MDNQIIKIDEKKCTACGMCANVCPRGLFQINDVSTSLANEKQCLKCYQCFAACPTEAIGVNCKDKVVDYSKENMGVDSDKLLNVMKFRRSVRAYNDEKISDADMAKILAAGKAAPKGKNRPLFRFIVVEDKIEEIRLRLMEELSKFASANDATNPVIGSEIVRQSMINIYNNYKTTGNDRLTLKAPCMIIFACDKKCGGRPMLDSGIAGAYMELMASTLGIGCCYLGFAMSALENSQAARDAVGLKESEMVGGVMVLGYPKYKFARTAPREDIPVANL